MGVTKLYDQTNPSFPVTVSGLDGNNDVQYLIEFVGSFDTAAIWQGLLCVPNATSDTPTYNMMYTRAASGPTRDVGTKAGFHFGEADSANPGDVAIVAKIFAPSGRQRIAIADCFFVRTAIAGHNHQRIACVWSNTAANITSLVFQTMNAGGTITGRLIVWKVTP